MKKLISILALCGGTLAAQAATTVNVTVVNGKVVAAAPVKTAGGNTIVWKLGTPGYVFAGSGISLPSTGASYTCTVSTDRKSLSCDNAARLQAGSKTKYQLLVEPSDTSKPKPVSPDFWIVNN